MKIKILISLKLLFLFFNISCQSTKDVNTTNKYLRHVGDIEKNEDDDPNFKLCMGDENVIQYFNLGKGPTYLGEKSAILKTFKRNYNPIVNKNQDGLIRIRFIVNCKGEAGRFRVMESDNEYNEFIFDEKIVSQLLDITKSIAYWEIFQYREKDTDYYLYLIFKLADGQIKEILP
jgi:hypothetical protein